MIISAYAESEGLSLEDAYRRLDENDGIKYLADCYEALHQLANEEVVEDLQAMVEQRMRIL
jgi:Fe2+ or Zn2+ uptake regulation protein